MTAGSIAIVGMACEYPDARSPAELWENVLARRRAFRRVPRERLDLDDYHDADPAAPDRTYASQAAVLRDYEFDRVRFRVSGETFRAGDPVHWLALDVADRALADAGFPGGRGLPNEAAGVVLGNTLTGEFSRAQVLRLRWPYVRRMVESALDGEGCSPPRRDRWLAALEAKYKAPFAPVGPETLAGGLSNTIAGRICNHFDWKGGGSTVDGACASSLLAVAQACSALAAGDLDVALAGGVDLSLDPFELVGFAKAGALAAREMRVFDAHPEGFWPGEGCGLVVLMRLEDARARGLRVLATVAGWGVSSDGRGGITRPEVEGQVLAIRRAYTRAGFPIGSVAYFEGHGTGTAVGDETELCALGLVRREQSPQSPPAAVGSIKANIGHTKAAAGAAGLIKAVMALDSRVIPPITGCAEPHEELRLAGAVLRIPIDAEAWPDGGPPRAGVSAMGFGGINAHIVLEGPAGRRSRALSPTESRLLRSHQDAELFLFAGLGIGELRTCLDRFRSATEWLSRAEMADAAAVSARELTDGRCRAAILASTPEAASRAADRLSNWLDEGRLSAIDANLGAFLGVARDAPPRIGFLFPGQGSPTRVEGGVWSRRFPEVRAIYESAALPDDPALAATARAQPAIVAASLAGLFALGRIGLSADVAVGHSLGELTALHWAGAIDADSALALARARGLAMSDPATVPEPGAMASLGVPADRVQDILAGTPVVISGDNGPAQTVISGPSEAVDRVVDLCRSRGVPATPLAVGHAFHSPVIAGAVPALAGALRVVEFAAPQRDVASTITGGLLPRDADLRALLCRQVTSPVRFREALAASGDVQLWIEVGPGAILSGLAADCGASMAVPLDVAGPSLRGLLAAAAAAFTLGADIRARALFDDRFTRPLDLDRCPRFLANPCESAPRRGSPAAAPSPPRPTQAGATRQSGGNGRAIDVVLRLVAERAEWPREAVRGEHRLLGDLHLNSITVGQLAGDAARELGLPPVAPLRYATATVAEMAEALEESSRTGAAASKAQNAFPPGLDEWTRPFVVEWVEREPSGEEADASGGSWSVFVADDHPLAGHVRASFDDLGSGVAVVLPPRPDDRSLALLLDAARAAVDSGRFVMVGDGRVWGAFARSLHVEMPWVDTVVVDIDPDGPSPAAHIAREARRARGYREARYDSRGRRFEPVLRLAPEAGGFAPPPVGSGDVVLVTGGGKGIAAECALALARATGARIGILGRSDPESDPALAENLRRLAAAGVASRYERADVADADQVRRAMGAIEASLGPVTAVIHAAGANAPRALSEMDLDAIRATVAPKVSGLTNALAAVDPGRLRLLVTFGSLIARTGMRGEAHYALANAWQTALTERFGREHPTCRCLALEWSVWASVGMGERLGRVEALAAEGIAPIPTEVATDLFLDLLRRPGLPSSVVVAGRIGDPPTVRVERPPLPMLRFLERVPLDYPGVELVAEADLSPETDPYLDEHVFAGQRLLPAVIGLEAMAQAASALVRRELPGPVAIEDVAFDRPVVVAGDGPTTIRLAALRRGPDRVEVVLRCDATDYQVGHFRATFRLDRPAALDASPCPARVGQLGIDPGRDLYGPILFQSGRFRRLVGYRELKATRCEATLAGGERRGWFGGDREATLLLGDPGLRDAAVHAIQACIPHATVVPVGVDRIVADTSWRSGPRRVRAEERSSADGVFTYDLTTFDESGAARERWEGLRLGKVGDLRREDRWPPELVGPYLERRLGELIPGADVVVSLDSDGRGDRRARSDRALSAAMGVEVSPTRRADGRPDPCNSRHVSTSHAGPTTLAVAGRCPVGCDIEPLTSRSEAAWGVLLRPPLLGLARRLADRSGRGLDEAGTRVWAAAESLAKLGVADAATIEHHHSASDGWDVFHAGGARIAVGSLTLDGEPGPSAFAIAIRPAESRRGTPAKRPAYEYRHIVGFEESNLVGNVYYVNHLRWQGRCREMFLRDHAPSILAELERDLVLVTARVSCEYLGEIRPFDEVVVRMTLGALGDSSWDFLFEYLKVVDGIEQLVARGEQSVACAHREPSGLKPKAIPGPLRKALERYVR